MKKLFAFIAIFISIATVSASAAYGDYALTDISFGEPYSFGPAIYDVQLTKGTTTYQDGRPVGITAIQGTPAKLQVIDLETMTLIDALEIPDCTTVCWQIKTAPDGSVYFGDFNKCNMYRYDPVTKTITNFGRVGTTAVVGIDFDENGNVYLSGNPSTALYKLDPKAGTITELLNKKSSITVGLSIAYHGGKVYYTVINNPADTLYAYDVKTGEEIAYPAPEGLKLKYIQTKNDKIMIHGSMPDEKGCVLAFDTTTKQFTNIIAEGTDGSRHFTPIIDGKVYFMKGNYAHGYALTTGEVTKTNMWYGSILRGSDEHLVELSDPDMPGLTYVNFHFNGGISTWNFTTQKIKSYSGMMEGTPSELMFCKPGPNHKFYVTQFQGTQGLEVDINTGARKTYPMSQATSIEFYDDKAYFASYSSGHLHILDTTKEYGSENPKILDGVFMAEKQQRIHSSTMAGDKIVFGSFPDYDELGGALSVFDPETEKLDIYRNIVPNQSILGVTYKDGKVYAGSSISGGLGIDASESMPKLFVFDLETRKKIKEIDVDFIPGYEKSIKEISGMTIAPDGNLLCATYNLVFKLDIETLELLDYTVVNPKLLYPANGQKLWYNTIFSYDEQTGFYVLRMIADEDGAITILDPNTLDFVKTKSYGAKYPQFAEDGNLYYYDTAKHAVKLPVIRGNDKSYLFDSKVILRIGENVAFTNKDEIQIDENPEIRPFLNNGNTMLPLRYLAEMFGYQIKWNEHENFALLYKGNESIRISPNSRIISRNGEEFKAPVTPVETNGRIFVHLRTISDIIGQNIYWDDATQTVVINKIDGEIDAKELYEIFEYATEKYKK